MTATANVIGTAQVGRSSDRTVVFTTPRVAGEGAMASLKDTVAKKRQGAAVASHKSKQSLSQAWTDGLEAAQNDDVSLADRVTENLVLTDLETGHAANLAAGAVMLLITLMIVLLAALVGGQFASAIPSDSVFNSAITTTTENAGTAFVIFGVSLLAIPTVSVLAYIVVKLGPFIGFGPGMGGGGSLMQRR